MSKVFATNLRFLMAIALLTWMGNDAQAQRSPPRADQPEVGQLDEDTNFDPLETSCDSCDPCDTGQCVYQPRPTGFWLQADYLLWWTKGAAAPPLVTTSPAGTPLEQAGVLDNPETTILYGARGLNGMSRSGGLINAGWWLTPCYDEAIEGSYLWLGRVADRFQASSDGSPILARPFLNTQTGQEASELVAFPQLVSGTITVDATSDFQAAEFLYRRALCCGCNSRIDFLIGYRFARLNDDLLITESLVSTNPTTLGATFDLYDRFDTQNQFHGAELGVAGRFYHCRWSLELLGKLALGSTRSDIVIDGSTETSDSQGAMAGGLLALPTNMGSYHSDHLAIIPELRVTLGYELSCHLRAIFGYSFLYWSNIARPGDQIDLYVNPTQLPPPDFQGAPLPAFRFATTDFWAQGMHFGLEYCF